MSRQTRRSLLASLTGVVVGLPLLAACRSAIPTAPASTVAAGSGPVAGGARLPTYTPIQGAPPPELPAPSEGIDPGYTSYPSALTVSPVAPGNWYLRITVEGKSTHCGNRPLAIRPGGPGDAIGVNALEKGVKVVTWLQELEQQWGMTKTHPYFSPVEHTAFARERLGDGKLLAVELAVVLAADESEAHAAADPYLAYYLALDNYRRNLARFGIDETNAFDKVVAWGGEEAIAARVREHLDAGADHVCVQPLGEDGIPRGGWTALAKVLVA